MAKPRRPRLERNTAEVQPPRVPAERPGPVGGKRDENRRRRIRQLCDAALQLFLEQGVEPVTIDQIVDAAGVAKGSFYRYFTDKAELVTTMFAPLASAVRESIGACAARLARNHDPSELAGIYLTLAADLAKLIAGHPDLVRLYLQENRSPAVGARAPIRALADEVARGGVALSARARDLGLLSESDPRVGALAVIGASERLLFGYLSGEDVGEPTAVPATLIALMLDGVRRR